VPAALAAFRPGLPTVLPPCFARGIGFPRFGLPFARLTDLSSVRVRGGVSGS